MSVRRTFAIVLLSNLVIGAMLFGGLYLAGRVAAAPAPQGAVPPGVAPVTYQFPLFQSPEDKPADTTPSFASAPTTPGTQYVSYAGSNFYPKTSNGVKTADSNEGCIYADDLVAGNPVGEPVVMSLNTIPQGAIITEMKGYWRKGSGATENLEFSLKRSNMLGVVDNAVRPFNSTSTTGVYTYTAATITQTITLDYTTYSYYAQVKLNRPGAGARLCGVRIGYVFSNFGLTPYFSNTTP